MQGNAVNHIPMTRLCQADEAFALELGNFPTANPWTSHSSQAKTVRGKGLPLTIVERRQSLDDSVAVQKSASFLPQARHADF
jgi:hypothetical protein